jgi:hypothetical protein
VTLGLPAGAFYCFFLTHWVLLVLQVLVLAQEVCRSRLRHVQLPSHACDAAADAVGTGQTLLNFGAMPVCAGQLGRSQGESMWGKDADRLLRLSAAAGGARHPVAL